MTSAQIIITVTIALYLGAMVFVGIYFGKKGSGASSDDFYLGGRKMGPIVTAMSAEASDMSSYLLMGLPGLAYLCGLPEVTWTAIGLALGTYLNWLIVARRLRRYSARLGAITIPDFFARRYGDKKHLLDRKRTYYRLLRQIVSQGQERGELSDAHTVGEIVKAYAMFERGLMYDWCLSGGEYSLVQYAREMMPMLLDGFRKK